MIVSAKTPGPYTAPTMHRGKFVILLIFTVAIAMSGYAWWYQYKMGRRSATFWTPTGVILVQCAPQVEFVPLYADPPDLADKSSSQQRITINGVEMWLGEPRKITNTRGLVHVRHALVDDMSYDWNATRFESKRWEFLLRFRDHELHLTAAFDTEASEVFYVEGSRSARFIPHINSAMRQKRDDWEKMERTAKP